MTYHEHTMSLKDQVIIITGASSGIGAATAKRLAREGAIVVLAARRAARLADLHDEIEKSGGRALTVPTDVSDRTSAQRMIDTVMGVHERIDCLVNNAGIMPLAPMSKCRIDDWDAMIDINLRGLLYCTGFALPIMLEQKTGHIINISSTAGRKLFPGAAVYCGTKHAVHAISDGLRSELAEQAKDDGNAIRVTTIAPGVVKTELAESIRDEQTKAQATAYFSSMDDPLQSEDIAESIAFALMCPAHVGINEILVRPTAQVR